VKKLIGVVAAVIVLCGAAAAYEGSVWLRTGEEGLTIAQASEGVQCPYCGEENEARAVYCANCGGKLPTEPLANYCPECGAEVEAGAAFCPRCGKSLTKRTSTKWKRNVVAIAGDFGGVLGDRSRAYIGCEVAFQLFDYFAFGPEISYFFGDTSGIFTGLEFRPYFVPYSRSTLVKPHAYVGGGYLKETLSFWGYKYSSEAGYARAGGGIDFRIPGNFLVPYFEGGAFVMIKSGRSSTKGQFEGGFRFAL
jgi:predicted RNA-binding Zn-ribbon protein involved in translation (DUF1610 family)